MYHGKHVYTAVLAGIAGSAVSFGSDVIVVVTSVNKPS